MVTNRSMNSPPLIIFLSFVLREQCVFFRYFISTCIYTFWPHLNKRMCGCDSYTLHLMQKICLDEVGGEVAVDACTQETTLIHHIFGGLLQSQVEALVFVEFMISLIYKLANLLLF